MPIADPEARRKYHREWMARRRAEFFSGRQCVKCGSTEQLELDHIEPATKTHHAIWSWSTARREAEIAKCQVLCSGCHKAKTFSVDLPAIRGYDPDAHNRSRYRKGCRCPTCSESQASYCRQYRIDASQSV